jgi:N-carbamoyl-L-amino-acid hydrolase
VESHIEQGPVLDSQKVTVGVVEGIVGLFRWNVRLIGTANHAGTTPMNLRRDAFQGLAEVAASVPRVLEEDGSPRSVATIGRVELVPGAANVVPGRAEFSLEVRDIDAGVLANLGTAFRRVMSAIARRRDLMFEFEIVSELDPVRCDHGIMQSVREAAKDLGVEAMQLPSGAAHDTQMMARIARAGMVFVPSQGGRSHSAAEWTAWSDIESGANVLLNTLYRLAS